MSESHGIGALAFESYLDTIGEEADRLGHAAEQDLRASVSSCPGWSTTDLLDHVTTVYERQIVRLAAGDAARDAAHDKAAHDKATHGGDARSGAAGIGPREGAATGGRDALDRAATQLLAALAELGPDAPCWNFTGHDCVARWVARRVALETAVHRIDAEQAVGSTTPVETELAVDGLDERIHVVLPHMLARVPDATLGGSLCLVCTDADAAVVVDVAGGRVRARRGRGPADAVVVGTASQLLLYSWGRVGPDALELTGDRDVALAWSGLPG